MDPRAPGVWRPLRARILDFLHRHSATTEQLGRKFFRGGTVEEQRKKASRWTIRERKRGRITMSGVVQRKDTGRPEIVYGRRNKNLAHEVAVAEAEIQLQARLERGVKVGDAEPDGVTEIGGERCCVEVDHSGKMNAKQMKAKWEHYGEVKGFILVIAMSEWRMRRIIHWSEPVREVAFFTTFDRLRAGRPWVDYDGKEAKL